MAKLKVNYTPEWIERYNKIVDRASAAKTKYSSGQYKDLFDEGFWDDYSVGQKIDAANPGDINLSDESLTKSEEQWNEWETEMAKKEEAFMKEEDLKKKERTAAGAQKIKASQYQLPQTQNSTVLGGSKPKATMLGGRY